MIKNKILIVFLVILILFISLFTTFSSAFSFSAPNSDVEFYNVPDLPIDEYKADISIMFIKNDIYYLRKYINVTKFEASLTSTVNGVDYYIIYIYGTSPINIVTYSFANISDGWSSGIVDTRTSTKLSLGGGFTKDTFYNSELKLIYCSEDIKVAGKDEIFFQKTPSPLGVKLVQKMKVEELPVMVNRLATILIPVGLIVFSAVLLISLIASKKWYHS